VTHLTSAVKPPRLRPGATIGVAAVSGPVDEARLNRGLAWLRGRGYRIAEAGNLRRCDGFLAGTDAERAEAYLGLIRDPGVEAVFFARGGYGASRILSRLNPREIAEHPKIHLGASDLTALFCFLWKHSGLVTFYGPMVAVEMADQEGLDWEEVLSGAPPAAHRFRAEDVLAGGRGEGPLLGGCLSLLASLAGTPEGLGASGAVLFWEDVGEEVYRLDRMLTQLERSGTFDGLQAMVIGSISPVGRGAEESPGVVRSWLQSRFAGAPFPVLFGLPAGHLGRPRTLPLGAPARVDGDRGLIEFGGPAVA
jgi:muramoyltetrapeptide carboxypeptidase